MSDRDHNINDMFVATLAFNAANKSDYSSLSEAAEKFAIVQAAVNALQTLFAAQTSGESSAAVEQKSVLKAAIRRKMRRYSKSARALNLGTPGFDKLFSVPNGRNEGILLATGREFVVQAQAHQDPFASLGIPKEFADALTADLNALEAAMSAKADAISDKAGATAGIDDQIQKGMDAEIILDAIMFNVYTDNPIKYAAWKTARHVKRAPQHAPTP